MTKNWNIKLFTPFLIGTIVLIGLISCGKKNEDSAQLQPPSKEVSALVDSYQKIKAIAMAGEVDQFRERRDSLTMATVDAYIARIGGKVDSARVSMWGTNWPNVTGLPLVQDTSNGEWRRLTFTIIGSKDFKGKEKSTYPAILFRKNGSTWKVSNALLMGSDKFDKNGQLILYKDMIYPPMFSIPPDFAELFK